MFSWFSVDIMPIVVIIACDGSSIYEMCTDISDNYVGRRQNYRDSLVKYVAKPIKMAILYREGKILKCKRALKRGKTEWRREQYLIIPGRSNVAPHN